jgi:hypothetical protein
LEEAAPPVVPAAGNRRGRSSSASGGDIAVTAVGHVHHGDKSFREAQVLRGAIDEAGAVRDERDLRKVGEAERKLNCLGRRGGGGGGRLCIPRLALLQAYPQTHAEGDGQHRTAHKTSGLLPPPLVQGRRAEFSAGLVVVVQLHDSSFFGASSRTDMRARMVNTHQRKGGGTASCGVLRPLHCVGRFCSPRRCGASENTSRGGGAQATTNRRAARRPLPPASPRANIAVSARVQPRQVGWPLCRATGAANHAAHAPHREAVARRPRRGTLAGPGLWCRCGCVRASGPAWMAHRQQLG